MFSKVMIQVAKALTRPIPRNILFISNKTRTPLLLIYMHLLEFGASSESLSMSTTVAATAKMLSIRLISKRGFILCALIAWTAISSLSVLESRCFKIGRLISRVKMWYALQQSVGLLSRDVSLKQCSVAALMSAFKVAFSDEHCWIVRVPKPGCSMYIEEKVRDEVAVVKCVKLHTRFQSQIL